MAGASPGTRRRARVPRARARRARAPRATAQRARARSRARAPRSPGIQALPTPILALEVSPACARSTREPGRVRVGDDVVGAIDAGLLILLAVTHGDDGATAEALARKGPRFTHLRGRRRAHEPRLAATGGAALCVSQFTLYGDVRRGRRPSFTEAAEPAVAEPLYERFCAALEAAGVRCERGRFGAHMQVESVNDGPVTLMIDSAELQRPRRP